MFPVCESGSVNGQEDGVTCWNIIDGKYWKSKLKQWKAGEKFQLLVANEGALLSGRCQDLVLMVYA